MKQMWLLFLALLLGGCAYRDDCTTFQIKTTSETNQNTPFYVLFKATDFPHFLTDDYKKIANQRMLATDDPAYLDSVFLIPGETKTIAIENPKNKAIGVYFIFTHPQEHWKWIAQGDEGNKVKILVGENEIEQVSAF